MNIWRQLSTVKNGVGKQPTTVCRLFLIDLLLLADATDDTAKPDANIDGH
jgi:hypothetical protein